MSEPNNRSSRTTIGFAIGLTCLLIGICAAVIYCSYQENIRLNDIDYLKKQVETLETRGVVQQSGPRRPPALVRIDKAIEGEIPDIRIFYGRLVEVRNTTISSEVSGLVLELPVEVGTQVKANETLIVSIDDTWTQFTFDAAKREIELTTTMLEYEQSELERLKPLEGTGAVSVRELLAQANKVDQLLTTLEKAKITHRESGEKLKRTKIYAPFDGYVVTKSTEIGSLLSPGSPIVKIVSAGEIDAVVSIAEKIADRLKIGDEIDITIDPLLLKVKGKVHAIVPLAPSIGPRSFPVHVRLSDLDGRLMSGMAVTAQVPASDLKEGIIVSSDAMLDKPDGRTVWVIVREPGEGGEERITAQPVPVKLLASAVGMCSVVSETEEGKKLLNKDAEVIVEGSERLTPGQVVTIKTVDPKYFEDLPSGSGHAIIRTPDEIEQPKYLEEQPETTEQTE